MPETTKIEFEYNEIAEALVRYNDIHEGIWGLSIKFGLQGTNIAAAKGGDVTPAAIIPVLKIGLQKFDEPNNLTVDAAEVNPEE